jgi:hypothetical protein
VSLLGNLTHRLREAANDTCTMGIGYHWNLHGAAADEICRLEARVSELEGYIDVDLAQWKAEGEALMARGERWSVLFSMGIWWADRPWRNKDAKP